MLQSLLIFNPKTFLYFKTRKGTKFMSTYDFPCLMWHPIKDKVATAESTKRVNLPRNHIGHIETFLTFASMNFIKLG